MLLSVDASASYVDWMCLFFGEKKKKKYEETYCSPKEKGAGEKEKYRKETEEKNVATFL